MARASAMIYKLPIIFKKKRKKSPTKMVQNGLKLYNVWSKMVILPIKYENYPSN